MCTLIEKQRTEKELERVNEHQGDEFRWKKKHENFIEAVKK